MKSLLHFLGSGPYIGTIYRGRYVTVHIIKVTDVKDDRVYYICLNYDTKEEVDTTQAWTNRTDFFDRYEVHI